MVRGNGDDFPTKHEFAQKEDAWFETANREILMTNDQNNVHTANYMNYLISSLIIWFTILSRFDRLALWWCSGPVLVTDVADVPRPDDSSVLVEFHWSHSESHWKTLHTPQPPYSIKRAWTTAANASYTSNTKCQDPCAKPREIISPALFSARKTAVLLSSVGVWCVFVFGVPLQ